MTCKKSNQNKALKNDILHENKNIIIHKNILKHEPFHTSNQRKHKNTKNSNRNLQNFNKSHKNLQVLYKILVNINLMGNNRFP